MAQVGGGEVWGKKYQIEILTEEFVFFFPVLSTLSVD